jgi:oligopeptide transport system ATP-binding protein
MERNIINVNNLKITFNTDDGELNAINGINMEIKYNEIAGIVGESGSGKSVTAYAITGLLPNHAQINSGRIYFLGRDLLKLTEKELCKVRGKEISMIFQDSLSGLNPVLSIGSQLHEVIKLHTYLKKKETKEYALELLSYVGIKNPNEKYKQYPHQLSGGMRQRVMIALTLACKPKLLIADEPTTALDATVQLQILNLIARLRKELNMSIILISHDFGVIKHICDNVAVMYAGRIVEYGSIHEILNNSMHPYTIGLLRSMPKIVEGKQTKLIPIKGIQVDMIQPPIGCAFAPRCERCTDLCIIKHPESKDIENGHMVLCWHLHRGKNDN